MVKDLKSITALTYKQQQLRPQLLEDVGGRLVDGALGENVAASQEKRDGPIGPH